MDPTQPFDPNRTVISGQPGINQTQMMQTPPTTVDPNRTSAMGPLRGLTAEVISSRTATLANGPAREQFLVEFHGAAGEGLPGMTVSAGRTPLNLCLVIDRSGSMEGPPLEYVKQACSYVVDLLSPNDVLSIVTFEEMVEVLMPPQRVTNKQPIKDGIARLVAGNTTNLYDGMALSAQQLAQFAEGGRATRMVLLTDGDPTSGIKDFPTLVQYAGEIKSRGITCTFLGFGPDYNEELIAGMAKKAGGNYYYIPRPELIPEIFRTELEKLMTVVARNLQLKVKLARWVNLRAATGQSVPPGEREFTLSLADLERGASLQQVFDLEFPNHPLGSYRVAAGTLTYEDSLSSRSETVDLDFVLDFTSDPTLYSAPVNPRVSQAAEIAAASRVVEKTIMGLKTGAITSMAAIAELQKTQMLLVQDGRTAEAQEVTMALRALQSGDSAQAEKTLMGTVVQLDQGKRS
jgi:Ca-activated chloride channel family protein